MARRPRVVVFAMSGTFSLAAFPVLAADDRMEIAAVVLRDSVPRGFPRVRLAGRVSIDGAAQDAGIPVIAHEHDDELAVRLADLCPDYLLVACYPRRLSASVLERARIAALNIHPSLLPRYRGPDPVFWQLRHGETRTGVTIHHVDEDLDTGAIVARREVDLPFGEPRTVLETTLARAGASLAASVVVQGAGPGKSQAEECASTWPAPGPDDFSLESDWNVRRAYAFMRGAGGAQTAFRISDGRESVQVRAADGWRPGRQQSFLVPEESRSWVRFADGAVRATPL